MTCLPKCIDISLKMAQSAIFCATYTGELHEFSAAKAMVLSLRSV